jgi:hypothetical protein
MGLVAPLDEAKAAMKAALQDYGSSIDMYNNDVRDL